MSIQKTQERRNAFPDQVVLDKEEIPKHYYNVLADMPVPLAPPKGDLSILPRIFPKALLELEMSRERNPRVPEEVRELYSKIGRPTPLYRARRLEEALNTPAKIYFKREDVTLTGSHKLNTAIPQAHYIAREGFKKVTTETGAGQWGSALALASAHFGIECEVFMVKASYDQKPYRKHLINLYGGKIHSSPSSLTETGKRVLKENPSHTGSLGVAIAEAIEVAKNNEDTVYSLGSVLNSVLTHQSVIGLETIKQFEKVDEKPDSIYGCFGGGSNFGGIAYPFLEQNLKKKAGIDLVAVEPREVPSLTKGKFEYDYGDEAEQTPMFEMYTLGHKFTPDPIYAGGLRYHGAAPSVSALKKAGFIRAEAYSQEECFKAAQLFARTEGICAAPESSHALMAAVNDAKQAKKAGEKKTILFNLSGHGLVDIMGYANVLGFK